MVSTSFMVDTSSHPRAQLHRCVEKSAYDLPLPVQLFDQVPLDMLSRVLCLVYVALRRYVYLFAPSLRRVPWPLLSEALRFPAFIGTMGAYDCSPTLPCHLWSPLAAGTPRRGPVRFPW